MEFFQDMAISHGSHFSPAYIHTLHMVQEHPGNIDAGAVNVFSRSHHTYSEEGMDETTLLQPACTSNPHLVHHTDSLNASSLGLCTTKLHAQFCEVSYTGSASAPQLPCKLTCRSWQEALSSPLIHPKFDISARTRLHVDMAQHQVECTSVDTILNLHHIQAGATNHSTTDTNYSMPKTLISMRKATSGKMPVEEALIAVHEKGIPPNERSFLSALREGDEAFFKQQLLVPMEGLCKDDIIEHGDTVVNDHDKVCYNHVFYDPHVLQHAVDDHNMLQQPSLSIAQLWHHQRSTSVVTDRSSMPSKNMRVGSSCAAPVNMSSCSKDNDHEQIRASQDSCTHSCSWEMNASRASKEDITAMHVNSGTNKAALPHITPHVEVLDSKKRSLADHDSAAYMAHSKRAHLTPQGRHSNDNMMRHSSSTSSLNMIDTHKSIATSSVCPPSKTNAKSSARNPLGPALNTNLKPRARQGTANDPQTVAARNRRERINARLKVLQELVPNGSKVDLVTMLEKAINYVKFLQLQLRVLSNDEFWQANPSEKVAMQHVLSMDVQEDTNNSCTTNNIFIDKP